MLVDSAGQVSVYDMFGKMERSLSLGQVSSKIEPLCLKLSAWDRSAVELSHYVRNSLSLDITALELSHCV